MTGAAMILAAGLGTRLRPLSDLVAKPMVPIGDRPAIAHVHDRVRLAALRIVANVHHRPEDLAAWARAVDVAVSHEPVLLGTAGGVANARPLLGEGSVLVWNGDILSELDPRPLVACHAASGALATLAFAPAGDPSTSNVGLDREGRVVRLRRRSFAGGEVTSGHFLGVHVIGDELRASLPSEGCLVGDVYLPALARGARLEGYAVETPFADIGDLRSYVAANRSWLAARGVDAWVAPSARIGAEVTGSIVGARAEIRASCTRCIVWPNAVVDAPVADAIVTTSGPIAIPS